ncbi:hypothetical protein [Herbaspirillum rubrisubalbicans]|uniref:hypothetical protein n=1 Tax=Herbaspirillum rubrisubalbicans TaxID=80842 RepID=UPI000A69D1B8|nr:hypothetical protein [Herbaspirillum rubrisubalbicans]
MNKRLAMQFLRQNIENLATTRSRALISIFSEGRRGRFDGIGTAFLLSVGDENIFLITALHVLDDAQNGYTFGIVNEKVFDLRELSFFTDKSRDLACARLTGTWLRKHHIECAQCIHFGAEPFMTRLGMYAMLGFPATKKNRFSIRNKRPEIERTRALLTGFIDQEKARSSDGSYWLPLEHNRKKLTDTSGVRRGGHPELHGFSGGPVLKASWRPILFPHAVGSSMVLDLELIGMVSHKRKLGLKSGHQPKIQKSVMTLRASEIEKFIVRTFLVT